MKKLSISDVLAEIKQLEQSIDAAYDLVREANLLGDHVLIDSALTHLDALCLRHNKIIQESKEESIQLLDLQLPWISNSLGSFLCGISNDNCDYVFTRYPHLLESTDQVE